MNENGAQSTDGIVVTRETEVLGETLFECHIFSHQIHRLNVG